MSGPVPTVRELLSHSTAALTAAGVDSPRLQAEWLLAHVLEIPRLQLYVESGRPVHLAQAEAFQGLLARRCRREPLQHLLGSADFCGLEIAVTPAVLIPRPETELLAERAWGWLGTLATASPRALDFGTGSGCLAIALAVHCPRARVYAVDLSAPALAVARDNARRHGVAARIEFFQGDGLAVLPPDLKLDLVVSNPPYIPTAEVATLQPEVRDFDPLLALDGGADGLEHYRRLAAGLPSYLAATHRALLEFGDGQAPAVAAIFRREKWVVERIENDYNGVERVLVAWRPGGERAGG